jgi:RNA 3'-terminal phosphate cyclase (ATP)
MIWPAGKLTPLLATERGKLVRVDGLSAVGNIPLSIAKRQKKACLDTIHAAIRDLRNPVRIGLSNVPGPGQGTFVFLRAESEKSLAGFTSLGARVKRAETVGEEAGREFIAYLGTGAALDPHLADQIVLYLFLCEEESLFTTSCITTHLLINLKVIGLFHEFSYVVDGEMGGPGTVRINWPESNRRRTYRSA